MTNLFGPSNKVVYLKKLVFESAVRFLILFVLTNAILIKLDLKKKDISFGQSSKSKVVCLAKMHHISKNLEHVFDFQYKVVTGQCE